jgi:glycosyltransferase involved in cell wall biosynthesis
LTYRTDVLIRRGKTALRLLKGLPRRLKSRAGRAYPTVIIGRLRRERVRNFDHLFTRGPKARRHAMRQRLATLLAALGASPPLYPANPSAALAKALADAGPDEVWLALAVLSGRLPDTPTVMRAVRSLRLDGPVAALFGSLKASGGLDGPLWPEVDLVIDDVLVDVSNTSRVPVTTGIQRVVRECIQRWDRDHAPTFVGWTDGFNTLRRLSAMERYRALHGFRQGADPIGARFEDQPAIVPWGCVFLIPELPAEPQRTPILQALASFSRSRTGLIGFDCVPMTNAETVDEGMAGYFARFLAAAAHMDRITTISHASEAEYRGWKAMLAGSGRTGPDIRPILLPVEAKMPTETALQQAHDLLSVGPLPIVLAVGSIEPRKNHLALLQAAEVLWGDGLRFTLTFVGGHRWSSDQFHSRIKHLQSLNRPVQTVRALPDELLWAAYRLAYFTVFPSIHEGFGLPVAESLASGTPVITSDFGSMKEIAGSGGALLVDPRDDRAIETALRSLLEDRELRERLAREAQNLPQRTWEQYAAETWDYLVCDPNR